MLKIVCVLFIVGRALAQQESRTSKSLKTTSSATLKLIFSLLYLSVFAGLVISLFFLMAACKKYMNRGAVARREAIWQNHQLITKFREHMHERCAFNLKQAQEQFLHYYPDVHGFCCFYLKRMDLPRGLACSIIGNCIDGILNQFQNSKHHSLQRESGLSAGSEYVKNSELKRRKDQMARANFFAIFKDFYGLAAQKSIQEQGERTNSSFSAGASPRIAPHFSAMRLKKRSFNGQPKSPVNSIIVRALRIKGKIDNLMRTPTVYELLKYGHLQKEKQEAEMNDKAYFGIAPLRCESEQYKRRKIGNHLLQLVQITSRRQSGTKKQRRIESDFKWLERFRVFLIFAQNIEQLDELTPEQLDLLRTKPIDEQNAQVITEEMKKRQEDKQDLFAYLHTQGNALWDFINSLQNLNFFDNLERKMKKWSIKEYENIQMTLHENEKEVRGKMNEFRGEAKFTDLLEFRNHNTLSPVHSEGEFNEEDQNSLLPKREHSFTLGRRAGQGIPKFEKEDSNGLDELRKKQLKEEGGNLFTNFDELIEKED